MAAVTLGQPEGPLEETLLAVFRFPYANSLMLVAATCMLAAWFDKAPERRSARAARERERQAAWAAQGYANAGAGWQSPGGIGQGLPYPGPDQTAYPSGAQGNAYPAGYPPYGPPPVERTNGMAIASLVIALTGAGALLAVIFGHIARSQIKRGGERGAGMALAGLIIGYIGIGLSLAVSIAFLIFAAVLS
jgi:hypothetical protein